LYIAVTGYRAIGFGTFSFRRCGFILFEISAN
jgi:hypothetical protein